MEHLKKEVRDQIDFLYVDKNQSFLQGDTILFSERAQTCPSYPK